MMKEETSIFLYLMLIFFCDYTQSVPDEYCLTPLNQSDCGKPPTAVFSYYKPGSRCEIKKWRGCATNNMFQDEAICSHHCIGRLTFYLSKALPKQFNKTINDLDIDELKKIRKVINNAMNETDEPDEYDETTAYVDEPDETTPPADEPDDNSRELLVGGKKSSPSKSYEESHQSSPGKSYEESHQSLEDSRSYELITRGTPEPNVVFEPQDYATIT